jgi:Leucine-rich repeat (LRR) protein
VSYSINNLTPDTAYYFQVETHTPAHGVQQNDLWSEYATVTYYGIPSAEYDTLLALYNGTGGSSWSNRTGWLVTDTPCAWHGVTCANSHVTGMELASNNLTGPLPALSALDYLETLDLGENQLTGPIPGLSTFTSLVTLDLSNNQLTGSIPGFPSSPSLTYIALGNNQLDGSIPSLSELNSLVRLYLWNNQLTGDIPDLSALPALEYFNANNNQLTGPFPNIGDTLRGLWLSGNRLNGTIPDLPATSALGPVFLDNNQLSGEVPVSLTTLPALSYLNLGYNQLTASDPGVIAFLNVKDPDWAETQTVPVTGLQIRNPAPTSIDLTWEPIAYTGDGGYYEIQFATDAAGPWSVNGQTADKSVDHYTVTGLVTNTHYYFQVKTFTPAHGSQQSDLESYCPDIMEYHVYWTLISEQEFFVRMQDEMATNPAIQEIEFALADFVPGAIRINVGTANGDVGMVVTSLTSENGLALLTIDSITLDGAPAPADYAAIINRELMPLLVSTLNALIEEKMGVGLDLDSMRVTDEAIEAAFPP